MNMTMVNDDAQIGIQHFTYSRMGSSCLVLWDCPCATISSTWSLWYPRRFSAKRRGAQSPWEWGSWLTQYDYFQSLYGRRWHY